MIGKHIAELDALRFFGNVLVVGIHIMIPVKLIDGGVEYGIWHWISQCFCGMALPLLFFISGYVVGNKMEGYWVRLGKRFKRLVLPFVGWNFIYASSFLIMCMIGLMKPAHANLSSATSILLFFAEKVFPIVSPPGDMPLWYLRAIFVFSLAYPILSWLLDMRGGVVWLKGLLSFGTVCLWGVVESRPGMKEFLQYTYPCYAILAFMVGFAVSRNGVPIDLLWTRYKWPAFIVGLLAVFLVPHFGIDLVIFKSSMRIVSLFVLVPFVPGILRLYRRIPVCVTESAFFIYAMHLLVLVGFSAVSPFILDSVKYGGVTVVVVSGFALSIILPTLILRLLQGSSMSFVRFAGRVLNGRM